MYYLIIATSLFINILLLLYDLSWFQYIKQWLSYNLTSTFTNRRMFSLILLMALAAVTILIDNYKI